MRPIHDRLAVFTLVLGVGLTQVGAAEPVAPGPSEAQIRQWVEQLANDDRFSQSSQQAIACRALLAIGEPALKPLEQASTGPNPVAQDAAQSILAAQKRHGGPICLVDRIEDATTGLVVAFAQLGVVCTKGGAQVWTRELPIGMPTIGMLLKDGKVRVFFHTLEELAWDLKTGAKETEAEE